MDGETSEAPPQAQGASRHRIRGARKGHRGKGGAGDVHRGQDASDLVPRTDPAGPETTNVLAAPIDILPKSGAEQVSLASSTSPSTGGASVSPRKRHGGAGTRGATPSHLQPLNSVAAAPAGRDTSTSRWASAVPAGPASPTKANGVGRAGKDKATTAESAVTPVESLTSRMSGLQTRDSTTDAQATLAPSVEKVTPQPQSHEDGCAGVAASKRSVLGGRSRWARPDDETSDTEYDETLQPKSSTSGVVTKSATAAASAQPSETEAGKVERGALEPAPATTPPRPQTPTNASSSSDVLGSGFGTPSQHIDWADDDDDELPPLDDWLQEAEQQQTQMSTSIAEDLFRRGAPTQQRADPVARTPRSRTMSNVSDVSAGANSGPAGAGRRRRGSKSGGGAAGAALAAARAAVAAAAKSNGPPRARDGPPHLASRGASALTTDAPTREAGARRSRGPPPASSLPSSPRRGKESRPSDGSEMPRSKGTPQGKRGARGPGPSGTVFAKLSGMQKPNPGGLDTAATGKRGGAGAPDGRPRW